MRFSNSKLRIPLLILVFFCLILPNLLFSARDDSEYIVKNIQVNDIENDDGTGLVISWQPLSKDKRIIEYRVYRGVTPDSLFYIQKIDVNVKTGVSGDVMYYYDKDYNYFLDIQAHRKMKREKGQPKDGNLFRRYPRDLSVSGPELKNYRILGVVEEKDYYYGSKKVEVEIDSVKEVYAGLKLHKIDMYKKLIPDKKYYYTILAVNEARKYFPAAEPVMGIPRENSPEKTTELYPVYVKDMDRLQFEWSLPQFKDDIRYHSLYILKKKDLQKFKQYIGELNKIEENDLAGKEDENVQKIKAQYENPADMIFRRPSAYPYTSMNSAILNIQDGKITDEDFNIEAKIDTDNLADYLFIFSLKGYDGYEVFSEPKPHKTIYSNELPVIPDFSIIDKKNDKGDHNVILWGKPVVYLIDTSYLNEDKTKLLVSYETVLNEHYKLRNVYFDITTEDGEQIDFINEYYQDNKFIIKLPQDVDFDETLNVAMSFKCNKKLEEDYIFDQQLVFNPVSRTLKPGPLYLGEEKIQKYNYLIYKRNYTDGQFRLGKKLTGSQREYEDNISYANKHFFGVSEFDQDRKLLLVSPDFTVLRDYDKNASVRTSLYATEINKKIDNYQEEIGKYQAMKDTITDKADLEEADDAIKYYEDQIAMTTGNDVLQKASEFKSYKSRIKFLDKTRRKMKRSFEYFLVKSDGKGVFSQSGIYVDESGNDHFIPVPNWFKTNMIPALIAALTFGLLVFIMISKAKKGHDLYIRPIAGIHEIDNAIGRATEMGKPILFVPGLSGIQDVATLAGLSILGRVAKKAAEYDTKILVPIRTPIVLPIAQEVVKEAHYEAGRPDTYEKNSAFFITTSQFAFVAGVNGIMIREKTATNFYMGMFWAEALIMTETGSTTGAIQIAGTDAITQIPFFITTCDYTLIGEELYAASAYLAREPLMLGTLKAQDYLKLIIMLFIILGSVLSSLHLTFLINAFPEK